MRVLLKREDLAHTGSHKLNNVVGQGLLARRMGKRRLIAETGAGQHGVATATAAALFGMECVVYMGEVDTQRQELNVFRMELLGAEVRPVSSGSRTLKDAVNEALRDWVASVGDTHYCLGSVMGPHPIRGWSGSSSGSSATRPASSAGHCSTGATPMWWWPAPAGAPTPPGSSPGSPTTPASALVAVEAAGGAAMTTGIPGVLHGMRSALMQDEAGQILEAHSISAGLDYPGIGPEHAHLGELGRARYETADDEQVLDAFQRLARTEGIIPALESAHALAWVIANAGTAGPPAGLDGAGQSVRAGRQGRGPGPRRRCGVGRERWSRSAAAGGWPRRVAWSRR